MALAPLVPFDHRYFFILDELGISVPVENAAVVEVEGRVGANLPALPTTIAAANRIVADTIDVAALVDNDTDREAARNRMRVRLVREQNGQPHIANIAFAGEVNRKTGDVHISQMVDLPELGKVKVTPLIYVDINYLIPIGETKFRSAGTFQCLVLKPLRGRGSYRAVPLGLADESTISIWNRIAREMTSKNWPQIERIKNNLRRPGIRRITYCPTHDPNFTRVKGSHKRLCIGELFGQKLNLSARSQLPEPDLVEDEKKFVRKHEFSVKLAEGSLELVWLGPEGEIKFDHRMAVLDVHDEMNPFEILGTSARKVDIYAIDRTARGYLNRVYDDKNPLFASAISLGLVYEKDPPQTKRAILEELMLKAIEQIKMQMQETLDFVLKSLLIAPKWPTLEEVLHGHEPIVVKRRLNEPTDAVAVWLSRVLDTPFDPTSPFHKQLRTWVIEHIEQKTRRQPASFAPSMPELPDTIEMPPEIEELPDEAIEEITPLVEPRRPSRTSQEVDTVVALMPLRPVSDEVPADAVENPDSNSEPRTQQFLDEFLATGTPEDQGMEQPSKPWKIGVWFRPGSWKDH